MNNIGDIWYRYEDVVYASSVDEYDVPIGPGRVEVKERTYAVLRVTPKGVWLNWYGEPKFVLADAKKRFAYPTREEARVSFLARKNAQARIYAAGLKRAQEAIQIMKRMTLSPEYKAVFNNILDELV